MTGSGSVGVVELAAQLHACMASRNSCTKDRETSCDGALERTSAFAASPPTLLMASALDDAADPLKSELSSTSTLTTSVARSAALLSELGFSCVALRASCRASLSSASRGSEGLLPHCWASSTAAS